MQIKCRYNSGLSYSSKLHGYGNVTQQPQKRSSGMIQFIMLTKELHFRRCVFVTLVFSNCVDIPEHFRLHVSHFSRLCIAANYTHMSSLKETHSHLKEQYAGLWHKLVLQSQSNYYNHMSWACSRVLPVKELFLSASVGVGPWVTVQHLGTVLIVTHAGSAPSPWL